jgi:hypothetical protein
MTDCPLVPLTLWKKEKEKAAPRVLCRTKEDEYLPIFRHVIKVFIGSLDLDSMCASSPSPSLADFLGASAEEIVVSR